MDTLLSLRRHIARVGVHGLFATLFAATVLAGATTPALAATHSPASSAGTVERIESIANPAFATLQDISSLSAFDARAASAR
jgi:hypothetical protein